MADRAVIVAVCANPAWDVTYTVGTLRPGEVHRVRDVSGRAGGKGANVARSLHQLGADTLLCAPVGGTTGARLRDDLLAARIPASLTAIAGETRRSVAVLDAHGCATVFNEAGPAITAEEWRRFVADVERVAGDAAVIVLSGSLTPGTPHDGYAHLTEVAHRAGAVVVLDTSGPALDAALGVAPDVAKPNAEEAAQLLGRPVVSREDARDAGRALVARGARAAVISRGEQGLVAVRGGGTLAVATSTPVSGNPTGAGDTLTAALARGIADGRGWRESLCEAVAVAAAAVAYPVAGGFDEAVLQAQRPLVRVEEF